MESRQKFIIDDGVDVTTRTDTILSKKGFHVNSVVDPEKPEPAIPDMMLYPGIMALNRQGRSYKTRNRAISCAG